MFTAALGGAGRARVRARNQRQDMLAYMKRTTVKISDSLDLRLRREAERRQTTISELTREALELHLAPPGELGRRRLAGAGGFESGRSDVSERIEDILREELGGRT